MQVEKIGSDGNNASLSQFAQISGGVGYILDSL